MQIILRQFLDVEWCRNWGKAVSTLHPKEQFPSRGECSAVHIILLLMWSAAVCEKRRRRFSPPRRFQLIKILLMPSQLCGISRCFIFCHFLFLLARRRRGLDKNDIKTKSCASALIGRMQFFLCFIHEPGKCMQFCMYAVALQLISNIQSACPEII